MIYFASCILFSTDCISFPSAMDKLLEMARTFAFDIFSEAKMPCFITFFDYYKRILIVIFAPIAFAVLVVLGSVLWSCRRFYLRRRNKIVLRRSALRREKLRGGDSLVKSALWTAAPIVLFALDLFFPTITRTLCQFFSCHDLGPAGHWLESDCT